MTIEISIAIALYVIMLILIFSNRNKPVPWKNIWFYVKAALVLYGIILLLNMLLMMLGKKQVVESMYSIWTYFYLFPVLIIAAYLKKSENPKEMMDKNEDQS